MGTSDEAAARPGPRGIKRILFWQIVLAPTYVFVGICLIAMALTETAALGPYTRWYNHRKRDQAVSAGLVGAAESRVIAVLGEPNDIVRYWQGVDTATDLPAPGAKSVSTYKYYPYPGLPFSKFEVHCTEGVVRSIEMFDD